MKSRIIKESSEELLEKTFKTKMLNIQATGMSYGSKAFAQVIFDMYKKDINTMGEQEKTELLIHIKTFVDTTLENSVENLTEAIESAKKAYSTLINTEVLKEIENKKENN